jgi:hypothetical protein
MKDTILIIRTQLLKSYVQAYILSGENNRAENGHSKRVKEQYYVRSTHRHNLCAVRQ